jgi:peroxiredoxin Q/BCP
MLTRMPKTPQVGEPAPDFELPGTEGPFKLSDHRGERVVLLFYPGDNTLESNLIKERLHA